MRGLVYTAKYHPTGVTATIVHSCSGLLSQVFTNYKADLNQSFRSQGLKSWDEVKKKLVLWRKIQERGKLGLFGAWSNWGRELQGLCRRPELDKTRWNSPPPPPRNSALIWLTPLQVAHYVWCPESVCSSTAFPNKAWHTHWHTMAGCTKTHGWGLVRVAQTTSCHPARLSNCSTSLHHQLTWASALCSCPVSCSPTIVLTNQPLTSSRLKQQYFHPPPLETPLTYIPWLSGAQKSLIRLIPPFDRKWFLISANITNSIH